MTTAHQSSVSVVVEDTAKAIFQNRAAYRRAQGLRVFGWSQMSETSREQFRSMAQAAIAAMQGHALVFGRPPQLHSTRWTRLRAWWRDFVKANIICDEEEL